MSLLLVDVDHFKKFNDHYGHQAGDECLRSVAAILVEQAKRPADVAARYGGEEFALLLPNTDAAGCKRVGEKIRGEIQRLGILHAHNVPCKLITVSVGGATFTPTDDGTDCASLIEAADKALYAAKEGGRNGVIMSAQRLSWARRVRA